MKHILLMSFTLLLLGLGIFMFTYYHGGNNIHGNVHICIDSLNPIRVKIEFELLKPEEAKIIFGDKDQLDFSSELSPVANQHSIELVGLKSEKVYNFRIVNNKGRNFRNQEIHKFETGKIPPGLVIIRWPQKSQKTSPGYILTQRRLAKGAIYILDNSGEIVWFQKMDDQPKLSHWTENNTILSLVGNVDLKNSEGNRIIEFNLHGEKLLDINLDEIGTPLRAHHEVLYTSKGELLVLVYDKRKFDLSSVGGSSDQEVIGDAIVLLDKKGNLTWKWSVFDYANPLCDKDIRSKVNDWSHANSVSIDEDGNYLISFRDWNQVWKINAENGNIIWKLGEGGDINIPENAIFSSQHACYKALNGEYLLFDNGVKNRKSRVLSFQIDEQNKIARVGINISLPEDLYSDKMGNATLIESNKILLCSPMSGSIVVLDTLGNILSHTKVGIPEPYRSEYIHCLYPGQLESRKHL